MNLIFAGDRRRRGCHPAAPAGVVGQAQAGPARRGAGLGRHSWGTASTWGFLAVGVVLLADSSGVSCAAEPLLPARIVADRTRGGAYLTILVAAVRMFGVLLFLSYSFFGLVYAPVSNSGTLGVAPQDADVASSTINTGQQLGGSVSTSLLIAIFASACAVASYITTHLSPASPAFS